MKRSAASAVVAVLAFAAAGCGTSRAVVAVHGSVVRVSEKGIGIGPGPFVLKGGFAGGSGSGLWGDGPSGPHGTSLGCLDRRRYSQAFGIENRSKLPVTLTGARGANPAPGIIDLVAIQLRLSPPAPSSTGLSNWGGDMDLLYRGWSDAPTRPVTIPPGRSATVQTNFLLRNCDRLAGGKTVVVPASLALRYRVSGRVHRKHLSISGQRIVLSAGPTRRTCAPVAGSASLVAADTTCGAARQAARACHPMTHPSFGTCTVSGVLWDCGRIAGPGYPLLENCHQPQLQSHRFSTVWIDRGLTLWGAFATARGRSLSGGAGTCAAGRRALRYRSAPLRLGPSFGIARVEFSLAGYRGRGDYGAHERSARAGIRVLIRGSAAKGAPSGSYAVLAGRVSVTRTRSSLGGTVYASLGLPGRPQRINLNGTWSCG